MGPKLLFAVALAAGSLSSSVFAHSPIDHELSADLAQLVERSNLVFLGQVENVLYRNAPGAAAEGVIPHTFVTYRVKQVLRGTAPGERVTMRFVGGPDGRGRLLTVSGVPTIQPGDEDLLFVSNTADPACPLVFCERGRFRILNQQVFDTHGSPVRGIAKNKVISRGMPPPQFQRIRYPTPSIDELMKNPEAAAQLKALNIAPTELRARYEKEAPKFIEVAEQFKISERSADEGMIASMTGGGEPSYAGGDRRQPQQIAPGERMAGPMSISEFAAAAKQTIRQSRRQPATLRSVDPNAPFVAAPFNVTPPLGAPPVSPKRGAMLPAETEELNALQANGFNPVLRK